MNPGYDIGYEKVAAYVAATESIKRLVQDPDAVTKIRDLQTCVRAAFRGAPWTICTEDLHIHPTEEQASRAYYDRHRPRKSTS